MVPSSSWVQARKSSEYGDLSDKDELKPGQEYLSTGGNGERDRGETGFLLTLSGNKNRKKNGNTEKEKCIRKM